MPKDRWSSLDDKAKAIWDSIEDKFKDIILGYTTSSPHISSYTPRCGKTPTTLSTKRKACDDKLEETPEEAIADEAPLSADLEPDPPADLLINAAKGSSPSTLPPGDIRRVMSKSSKHCLHTACIEYKVSYQKEHHGISPSLVDRGANSGVAGNDVRVIFKTNLTVDIKGIDNHRCTNIDIGTVGGVIHMNKGPVIGIMNQYALLNKGSSIHSPCPFEWYKNDVNDKSFLVPGGLQRNRHSMDILYLVVYKMVSHVLTYVCILIKNLIHYLT
jgi:hypothetical protein